MLLYVNNFLKQRLCLNLAARAVSTFAHADLDSIVDGLLTQMFP